MAKRRIILPDEIQHLLRIGIPENKIKYTTDKNGRVIELELGDTSISDLSLIREMKYLKKLILNRNKIADLKPISALTNLTYLSLDNNPITNLKPISALTNLTYLYLSYNQITDLKPINALTNLTDLYLDNNQITDLKPISALTNLTYLFLDNNQVTDLKPISALTNLTDLYLSYNQITDLKPISALTNLTDLYLDNNQITDLKPISALTNLTDLYLDKNQITDLKPISALTNLTYLSLDNNQITDLKPISALTNLTDLYLDKNQITDLKPILLLPKLTSVSIDDNPVVSTIPPSTLAAGWSSIKAHQLSIDAGEQQVLIQEAKVLLLGNPNVGKSDLLYYLETGKIYPKGHRPPTHGLVYKELDEPNKNWKVHCWDFGGQEFYHATHQLFFSPGALHILLWSHEDVRREGAEQEVFFELGYWLRCIEQLAKDGSSSAKAIETLLVENKIDLQGNTSTLLRQPGIQERINSFTNLRIHISSVSIENNLRLTGLKELITERIPQLFDKHPPIYKEYRDRIRASGKAVLLLEEIDAHAAKDELISAMKVLHNIGCLLYFPDMIPGKVFAKPDALLALLYTQVLHDSKKYTLTFDELTKAVKKDKALKLSVDEVKQLLLGFHLVFQLSSKENAFYIPQYLPDAPPWMDFFERHYFKKVYVRIVSDSYLMHNALLRLFTHYAGYIKTQQGQQPMFWKDGLVIERDGQILLIKFNRKEQCIDLYNDIEDKNFDLRKEIMEFVVSLEEDGKDVVNLIELKGTKQSKGEPDMIIHTKRKREIWESTLFQVWISTDGTYFAPLKKIVENADKKIYYVEALDGKGNKKACSVFDFNKYLPNNKRGALKKIFISYSKTDLALVNKFEDHLTAMKLDGKVASWYCTELRAGSNWDDEIRGHFDEADIVCFMVSPNFMKTKYIHEYEIKWAVDRKKEKKDILIIPIILNFCGWQTEGEYSLGQYTALPYKATPVMDFDNQDMAWYLVTECIRLAISNGTDLKHDDFYSQQLPMDVRDLYERIINKDTGKKQVTVQLQNEQGKVK